MFRTFVMALALVSVSGVDASDVTPAKVWYRHARALIPALLEAEGRRFGVDLKLDPQSLTQPVPQQILDPFVMDGAYARLRYNFPAADCQSFEGTIITHHARAIFFVRRDGQYFRLVHTCDSRDARAPRLAIDLPGPRFVDFTDDQIRTLARPLLARYVGAKEFTTEIEVKRPWYVSRPESSEFQSIYDDTPPFDCRKLTFSARPGGRPTRLGLHIEYDADGPRWNLPGHLQVELRDAKILRSFRVMLTRGCGWFDRGLAPIGAR